MTGERDDVDGREAECPGASERGKPRLAAVPRPLPDHEPPPPVRLRREFKGLTVADLLRDEIVERLPGQARSALRHIERGDHAAAEGELPGEFARVIQGPWQPRHERRLLVVAVAVAAVLAGLGLANWLWA